MSEHDATAIRLDYFAAGRFGKWRLLHPVMRVWRNSDADCSEACLRFSRGQVVRADNLDYVYDYYRTVWTSVATVSVAVLGVSGILIKALAGSSTVKFAALALITLPSFFVLMVAVTLIGIGVLRGGLSQYQADLKAKPKVRDGDRFQNGGNTDFMVSLSVGLIGCVIALLAVLFAR